MTDESGHCWRIARRLLALCLGRALWLGILLAAVSDSSATDDAADQENARYLQRKYAGLSLEEWQARMKTLPLQGDQSAESVSGLMAILGDGELPPNFRRQAAFTLGRIGRPARAAVPVIVEILATTAEADIETRLWCLKALSHFGPLANPATPLLVQRVSDPQTSHEESLAIIDTFSRMESSHADIVPTLSSVLRGQLPPGASKLSAAQRQELQGLAADSLAALGPAAAPATPALIRALDDAAEQVRRKSAFALGAIGTRSDVGVPALARAVVFDESPAVRDAAADALAGVGVEALPMLRQLLSDADAEVRWRAAAALGKIGPPAVAAVAALEECFADMVDLVRVGALEAHWQIARRADPLVPAILKEFENENRQMRIRAYRLLVRMGAQARIAIEPLRKLQNDPRPAVSQAARQALRELSATSPLLPALPR